MRSYLCVPGPAWVRKSLSVSCSSADPRFLKVPGLLQKIYGHDNATGDVCGIYFFKSQVAMAASRETELAKAIPAAYEVVEFRPEVYDLLYPLRPERGPFES